MKKIYLEITPFFPTEDSFRGPFVFDQVNSIQKNSNYDVKVIKVLPLNYKPLEKSYDYQGIHVYTFGYIELTSFVLPGLFHKLNYYRFLKFLKNELMINVEDIVAIHSHVPYPAGFLGTSLGKDFNIKNFIQHHSYEVFMTDVGRFSKGFLKKLNDKYIYKCFLPVVNTTDLNITVSQKILDRLEVVPGFKNKNSYVLYNGVDQDKFYKKNLERDDDRFTIGCIANFWDWKDQMTLIKAIEILREMSVIDNIVVKFIGTGPTRDICEVYVKEHQLTTCFQFLNEVDHSMLNNFYNSIDLFVLPSYKEAFGCVFAEALQVGVPIITVKAQGIEELIKVKDRERSLIEKGSSKQLAALIKQYMSEPKRAEYDLGIDHFIKKFMKENYL